MLLSVFSLPDFGQFKHLNYCRANDNKPQSWQIITLRVVLARSDSDPACEPHSLHLLSQAFLVSTAGRREYMNRRGEPFLNSSGFFF